MAVSSGSVASGALVLGTLAVAAIPAAGVASYLFEEVDLLQAQLVAVPVALVLGLAALSAARRARYRLERSIGRAGEGIVRAGRLMAWAGLYVAVTGCLALAFYGALVLQSRLNL